MMRLDDRATGTWLVETVTASYVLDMDARTVVRRPKERAQWSPAELRKDEEIIPLIKVAWSASEGYPLQLVVDVRGDGVLTERTTTPVQRVLEPGSWS